MPKNKDWYGMNWIRAEKRFAIYMRDDFRCAYCGADLRKAAPGQMALDHLIPRCKGGSNEASNLVTACKPCNSARGARSWRKYATAGAVAHIPAACAQKAKRTAC